MNYDLRYELQEERKMSEQKMDFEEEKKKAEGNDQAVSNRAVGGAYADLSVNKDVKQTVEKNE